MHNEAYDFIKSHCPADGVGTVVECGARDINGSVKDLFTCDTYTAVDILPGQGVDVVCDFADYTPSGPVDVVVSTEVYEHAANWPQLIEQAAEILKPGGLFLATMATTPRAPHSGIHGGGIEPGEFYGNVAPNDLEAVLSACFSEYEIDVLNADLRCWAVK